MIPTEPNLDPPDWMEEPMSTEEQAMDAANAEQEKMMPYVFPAGVAKRFWRRVEQQDGDACWEWTASRFVSGYGAFGIGRAVWGAHRVAWVLAHECLPAIGQQVCHTCDNPGCVRPSHLFVGTAKDNLLDMARKGRNRTKLTNEQATEIVRRYLDGGVTQDALAAEFGVTQAMVSYLVKQARQNGGAGWLTKAN